MAVKFEEKPKKPEKRPHGRPKSGNVLISIRLDPRVIETYRRTGDGWHERINITLRNALGLK